MKKLLLVTLVIIFVFSISNAKTHTVKKGDTLWDIAGYYLNNPFLWPEIYELNKDKIEDPHWIYPGQVFELPIPGEDNTSVTSQMPQENAISPKGVNKFKKIKYTDLRKRYTGKKLSIAWLKAQKMIMKGDYLELFRIPNNVSYQGLYYGGFVTNKVIEKGKISDVLGDNSLENEAVTFDRVKIDIGKGKINKGDELTVFSYGNNVTANGKTGRIVKIYGTLKVLETFDTYSVCMVKASRVPIRKGMMVTDVWTPYYIPDFDFVRAGKNIKAKILGYRDNEDVVKDYNIVYVDKGENEGFAQGDKFNIVDTKGNAHGEVQLLWVGDDFSTGYITRTGDINLKKYKTITLTMKSLPKGETNIIKQIPVKKVTKVQVEEETPKVVEEQPKVEEEKGTEPPAVHETIGDTVRSDSNAIIIMERPDTTAAAPVVKETTPMDTTSPVIEEQPSGDTTSPVIEEQPSGDTTSPVIEEQPSGDTTSVKDTTSNVIIEEGE